MFHTLSSRSTGLEHLCFPPFSRLPSSEKKTLLIHSSRPCNSNSQAGVITAPRRWVRLAAQLLQIRVLWAALEITDERLHLTPFLTVAGRLPHRISIRITCGASYFSFPNLDVLHLALKLSLSDQQRWMWQTCFGTGVESEIISERRIDH